MDRRIDRTVTISMSEKMLRELDYVRHQVSRSKYLQNLIQNNLDLMRQSVEL